MRKVVDIKIEDDGRDKGKVFRITEMSAEQGEAWAVRAFLALAKSEVDIGATDGTGMAGIAVLGLKALSKLKYEDLQPLMEEMFGCIVIVPDPKHKNVERSLVPDDIEEITTRIRLRAEVFTVHTGFSLAGDKLKQTLGRQKSPASSTIPTSHPQSPPSSQEG